MISVLIPVYNSDVRELVTSLVQQFTKAKTAFEICLIDDASVEQYREINRELAAFPNCSIEIHHQNKGRLETRIELAKKAKYQWLLFIDTDCIIDNENYISNYLEHLLSGKEVIVGGTNYSAEPPKECNKKLHWLYGGQRIAIYTTTNSKNPYTGFLFNNVLILKELFSQLTFPPFLNRYGHEDTWVGIQLEEKGAKLKRIDNPVIHPQLDDAAVFIKKNIQALKNLKSIVTVRGEKDIKKHVKIYRYHLLLKRSGGLNLFNFFVQQMLPKMENNLAGCRPILFYFDLLRLYHLNKILET